MGNLSEEYPEEIAQEFDFLYRKEKAALKRAIDKIFNKGVKEGHTLTLLECKNISGKRILDIGCGAWRMSTELVKRGAHVTGIDSSHNMIDRAKLTVEKERVQDKLTLIHDDFAGHTFNGRFNISLALEVFDYTKDAVFYVSKMKALTTEKCIMSFPSKLAFQVPLRMIWLRSRNLPVCFYTKNELKSLLSQHFQHYKIKNISARYFCVASIRKPRPVRF